MCLGLLPITLQYRRDLHLVYRCPTGSGLLFFCEAEMEVDLSDGVPESDSHR